MYYYYYDMTAIFFMIISVVISGYAHFKVKHAFKKYSQIPCSRGITGAQAADIVLKHNHVNGVAITSSGGSFTDHFNPKSNSISLSQEVCDKSTIAAVSVAAHEAGHATQYATDYSPLNFRSALVPVCNFGSMASTPLIILGLVIPSFSFAITLGIILFSVVVLFQLVTLPVEFNASKRALETIQQTHLLSDDELNGAKKVLTAAALTYVAAAFVALLQLLRLLLLSKNRRD